MTGLTSMSNPTTGSNNFHLGRFLTQAGLAAAFTAFALLWLISQFFTRIVLLSPCLPDSLPPPGFEAVDIPTRDGYRLRGLWHGPQNGAVILMMGGIGANRSALLREAQWLAEEGFGSLLIENRNCQGGSLTLGFKESRDFLDMIDFAREREDVEWFGAFGFSAGAAAAIRAAAQTTDIRAVVAEGGYADLADLLAPGKKSTFSMEGILEKMILVSFWRQLRFHPAAIDPRADLEKLTPTPVLLIYGSRESNRTQAEEMLRAAGANGRLWIVDGATHGEYAKAAPGMYKKTLLNFFTQAQGGLK